MTKDISTRNRSARSVTHFINFQRLSQMLCSSIRNLILIQVKYGQRLDRKFENITRIIWQHCWETQMLAVPHSLLHLDASTTSNRTEFS